MIINLPRAFPSRHKAPIIDRVETDIFVKTYFTYCMKCQFCGDFCCKHGVDVDIENVARLESHAEQLEKYVPYPKEQWFKPGFVKDKEFPGARNTRTQVKDGGCVFLDKKGRGCLIHKYCIDQGIDFHELKPMVSTLFPVTFDHGLLHPAEEVLDSSLVCLGQGPTLYRGVRDDLEYYFGAPFIEELDKIEKRDDWRMPPV